MRLWSIHPQYLDDIGLISCWREALGAQAVLAKKTKGYANHPQLQRFLNQKDPVASIGMYLTEICIEGQRRNFKFDETKIINPINDCDSITVTDGQIMYEWGHFMRKCQDRTKDKFFHNLAIDYVSSHPLFTRIHSDEIESWERAKPEVNRA